MIRKLLPILGVTFIDIIGFSMLIPMLPYFVTHFGASPFVVGVLFGTFSLCQLVTAPLWGQRLRSLRPQTRVDHLADRRHHRLGDARLRSEHRAGLRRAHYRGRFGRQHQYHAGLRRRPRGGEGPFSRVRTDRRHVRRGYDLRPVRRRTALLSLRFLGSVSRGRGIAARDARHYDRHAARVARSGRGRKTASGSARSSRAFANPGLRAFSGRNSRYPWGSTAGLRLSPCICSGSSASR